MRWAEVVLREQFYVSDVEDGRVWMVLGTGEEVMDIPYAQYIRMFGRRHAKPGYIGTVVVKVGADGKARIRGWPYKRKWTAEEIAEIKRKADKLADALGVE